LPGPLPPPPFAAAALAVVTLKGSDDRMPDTTPVPVPHSGLIEHGSIQTIEGSVEDDTAR
jgi:hypothetical protein